MTRACIYFAKIFTKMDGWPGQGPAMTEDGVMSVPIRIRKSPPRREAGLPHQAGKESLDLGVGDLAAGILLPDVDGVIDAGHVALLVVGQLANHGIELLARFD